MRTLGCVRVPLSFRHNSTISYFSDTVLRDLEVASYFHSIILSEEVGIEKPSSEIFLQPCAAAKLAKLEECVHVGDELYWYVYLTSHFC